MRLGWYILLYVFSSSEDLKKLNWTNTSSCCCVYRRALECLIQHKSHRFTFSWAAVGSVTIWPSVAMAQVTPQNRQLIGRPASIRAIQAAFRKQDRSWGTGKEDNTFGTPFQHPTRRNEQPNIGEVSFFWRILNRHHVSPEEREWERSEDVETGAGMPHRSPAHSAPVIAPSHLENK